MGDGAFLAVAVVILGFGLVSRRLEGTVLTPPMVFIAVGWLIGPDVFGLLDVSFESGFVETVFELTLVIVLFTDASRIELAALKQGFTRPLRLLGIGLPLTIVLGTLAGLALLDGLQLWEAAVLAVVLAPTDAALGAAVVNSPEVPTGVRQTINVESGLNDGIAVPVLFVAISLAAATTDAGDAGEWAVFAVREIGLATLVGVAIGWGGGTLVHWGHRSGWMSEVFERLAAVGLALAAFALADLVDASGFIAAFVAGVAVGNLARPVCTPLFEFAEAEGELLTLLTFLFFGAVGVPLAIDAFGWRTALYVLLSLTVVRMIPVLLSLIGSGLHRETRLFIGWFGPRGIATVVFAIIVLEHPEVPGEVIVPIASLAVVASALLHGITAAPWARHLGRSLHAMDDDEMAEMEPAPDLPMRVRRS